MQTNIRNHIIENFKNDTKSELKETITESVSENIEETLPGLGVFMEIIWRNADEKLKDELLEILKTHLG